MYITELLVPFFFILAHSYRSVQSRQRRLQLVIHD